MITKKVFNIDIGNISLQPLRICNNKVIVNFLNNLYFYNKKRLYNISENTFLILYDNNFIELNRIIYVDIRKINDKYTLLIKEYICDTEKVNIILQTNIYTNTIEKMYDLHSRGKIYFNLLNNNYILYGYNTSDDINLYVNVLYDIENNKKINLNKIDFKIQRSYLIEFNNKKFLVLEKNDLDRWNRKSTFFYRWHNNMNLHVHESFLMLIDLEDILIKDKCINEEIIEHLFLNKMSNFIGYYHKNIFYELIDFKTNTSTIVKYNIVSKEKEYINIKFKYDLYIQFNGKDFYIVEDNKIIFLNHNKNIKLHNGRTVWHQFINNKYCIIQQVKPGNKFISYIYNIKNFKFKQVDGFIYYMEHSDILIKVK